MALNSVHYCRVFQKMDQRDLLSCQRALAYFTLTMQLCSPTAIQYS